MRDEVGASLEGIDWARLRGSISTSGSAINPVTPGASAPRNCDADRGDVPAA